MHELKVLNNSIWGIETVLPAAAHCLLMNSDNLTLKLATALVVVMLGGQHNT